MTKAASDAGIVIVAAAGNGNENLDHFTYQSYRNRGDSGAIIVGAGSPDNGHTKLDFSTYGARVDLQAWGSMVYTTGYGDALQMGGDINQAYTFFGGTSSATPIVASCAVVLQGYYHDLTGNYLTGLQLRDLMVETGTPQGSLSGGSIGPIPNMEAAIASMASLASSQNVEGRKLVAYPNPVDGFLNIPSTSFSGAARAEVYNALGQVVHSATMSGANGIDFSSFSAGVYTVKVTDGDKILTQKIIRK
jgi:subtilisin family serine protease